MLITPLLGLTLGLGGCKDCSTSEKADASTQGIAAERDAETTPGMLAFDPVDPVRIHQIPLAGEVDAANRYLFTVLIDASPSTTLVKTLKCSGVLIAPRLVLTAAHCVCIERADGFGEKPGGALIDASGCVSSATVMTMTYQPQKPGENLRALHESYEGVVRPHPELRIQLDAQNRVTTAHANLAVILLDEPVPDRIPSLKLAESEIKADESLVLSGYGSDGSGPELYGQRRFNKVQVANLSADHEQIFLGQPKHPFYANDSGGPCTRETEQGSVLVGLSSRGLGSEFTCMNTYFHKSWLRDEIHNAVKTE